MKKIHGGKNIHEAVLLLMKAVPMNCSIIETVLLHLFMDYSVFSFSFVLSWSLKFMGRLK